MKRVLLQAAFLGVVFVLAGCMIGGLWGTGIRPPSGVAPREYRVVTTGYCKCGECCNWKRNWLFRPVIASGPNKGRAKAVGITASGARVKPGTLAADTSVFPFGTIIHVPGYGYGRVEDRGGDIKGYHLDLYYTTHGRALEHGRQTQRVTVWFPPGYTPKR